MEHHGIAPGASGLATAIKPFVNSLSYPILGWAMDRFKLCPFWITNLLTVLNGFVFLAWPLILGNVYT